MSPETLTLLYLYPKSQVLTGGPALPVRPMGPCRTWGGETRLSWGSQAAPHLLPSHSLSPYLFTRFPGSPFGPGSPGRTKPGGPCGWKDRKSRGQDLYLFCTPKHFPYTHWLPFDSGSSFGSSGPHLSLEVKKPSAADPGSMSLTTQQSCHNPQTSRGL